MDFPNAKATKTHEAPTEADGLSLWPGDLLASHWYTQDDVVWLRVQGFCSLVGGDTYVTVLPPAKDERTAVTFLVPDTVYVMRRKVAPEDVSAA